MQQVPGDISYSMISVATKKERLGTCISGVKPAAENLKMLQNCKTIRGFTPVIKDIPAVPVEESFAMVQILVDT